MGCLENLLRPNLIMLNCYDGLPSECSGIPYDVQLGRTGAVEGNVQPVIVAEALGRVVLIRTESYLSDSCPTLHFDKAHLEEGLRVMWMWAT